MNPAQKQFSLNRGASSEQIPISFSGAARRNLTVRLSGDDGATWPHSLVLNKGLSAYSGMVITKAGKILCVYENGKADYCEKISTVQVDRTALVAPKAAPAAAASVAAKGQ